MTPLTVVTKHKPTTLPTGTDITSAHELETGPTTGTTINNHHHINRHHSGCHWHHVNRRQPSTSVIPIISHLDPCHDHNQPATPVIPVLGYHDPCHHRDNQVTDSDNKLDIVIIPVKSQHWQSIRVPQAEPLQVGFQSTDYKQRETMGKGELQVEGRNWEHSHIESPILSTGRQLATTLPLMSSTSHSGIISSSSDRQFMELPTGRRLGSPQTSPETEVHRLLLRDSEMTERMATIYGGGTSSWITNWKFERLQANNNNITRILISIPHNPTHSLLTHSQVNRDTYWSGNTLSIAAGSYDANYSRRNNFIFMGELGINLRDESESATDATVTAIFYLSHLFKFKLSLTGTGLGIAVQVTITDNPFHPSPPNPEPTTGINLTKNLSINSTSPAGTSTNLPVNDKRSESDSSPMTINPISRQSHQSLASESSITYYTSLHLLDVPYYYWVLVLLVPRHLFDASRATTTISPSLSGFLTTLKSTSSIATVTTSLLFNTKAYYSSPSNHYAATTTMLFFGHPDSPSKFNSTVTKPSFRSWGSIGICPERASSLLTAITSNL